MPDQNYRPSRLPAKLGPTKDNNDGVLLTLLSLLDPEMAEYCFNTFDNSLDYENLIIQHFGEFQTWCWEIYVSMNVNKDKTYLFFKDALRRYQSIKDKMFSEKENQIYHCQVTLPISKEGNRAQQMGYIAYENINKAIDVLEDYVQQASTNKSSIKANDATPPLKKIHGFRVKNHKCLNDAFDQLKNKGFIDEGTSKNDFEKVFSGRILDRKIIWLKGPGLLSYFIKYINNKGIEDEKKHIWDTSINCFQDINKNAFTIKQLRFAKKPSDTKEIDFVIDTINEDAYSEE